MEGEPGPSQVPKPDSNSGSERAPGWDEPRPPLTDRAQNMSLVWTLSLKEGKEKIGPNLTQPISL